VPNTSFIELRKRAREAGGAATHASLCVQSAGREGEDEKNQDRLSLGETRDGGGARHQFAIVCDGTSTSPFSAEAAAYVSAQAGALFEEDALRRVVASLRQMRAALLERPLEHEEGQSELLRSMFEEIVRQKYQVSYQTTFVAVRLKRDEEGAAGSVTVRAVGCGDSALFIFREDGELLYNNLNLADASDPFKHTSPFTAVLPDSYDEATDNVLLEAAEFPEDVHLLLCSDGFYDGFTNFREALDWLREHRAELSDPAARDLCARELHQRLEQKKGDDDISFIWLHPAAPPPEAPQEAEEAEVMEHAGVVNVEPEGRRAGLLDKLLAFLLRPFRRAKQDSADAAGASKRRA